MQSPPNQVTKILKCSHDIMKTQTSLANVGPTSSVAIILGTPNPGQPAIPERGYEAAGAACSNPPTSLDKSAKFREEIRRRNEMHFQQTDWHHEGISINEEPD
jgi:hypothetical protein